MIEKLSWLYEQSIIIHIVLVVLTYSLLGMISFTISPFWNNCYTLYGLCSGFASCYRWQHDNMTMTNRQKLFTIQCRFHFVQPNILKDIPTQFKQCSFLQLMIYKSKNFSLISSVHLKDRDKRQLRQPSLLCLLLLLSEYLCDWLLAGIVFLVLESAEESHTLTHACTFTWWKHK